MWTQIYQGRITSTFSPRDAQSKIISTVSPPSFLYVIESEFGKFSRMFERTRSTIVTCFKGKQSSVSPYMKRMTTAAKKKRKLFETVRLRRCYILGLELVNLWRDTEVQEWGHPTAICECQSLYRVQPVCLLTEHANRLVNPGSLRRMDWQPVVCLLLFSPAIVLDGQK